MIMSFLITLFFVVSEINGVPFLEGEEGEFLKLISPHLFLLFLFVLISNPSDPLSVIVFASKLCVLFEQKGKKINLKNRSLVILNKNIAANTFPQFVLALILSGE